MVDNVKPQTLAKFFEDAGLGGHVDLLQSDVGGPTGLAERLGVDLVRGLDEPQLEAMRARFGANTLPPKRRKRLWEFVLDSSEDPIVGVLFLAACVSLLLNLILEDDKGTAVLEPLAIFFAISVVIFFTTASDYVKEAKFAELESEQEKRQVKTVRQGLSCQLAAEELVVGDVLIVETGDYVAADAVLLKSSDVRTDESSLTGETQDVKKSVARAPFLFSGSRVMAGSGRALVCQVGRRSLWGILKLSVRLGRPPTEEELANPNERAAWKPVGRRCCGLFPAYADQTEGDTPLQERLGTLAGQISWAGLGAALFTLVGLLLKWGLEKHARGGEFLLADMTQVLQFVIVAITIVVVAVPEGLPLAVLIALAYSQRKMMQDRNLVRHLSACETSGSCTDVCTDKTGTLTQNLMTVVRARLAARDWPAAGDAAAAADLSPETRAVAAQAIAVNSTAFIGKDERGRSINTGSKTECALLAWLNDGWPGGPGVTASELRDSHFQDVAHVFPFSSAKKSSAVVMALNEEGRAIIRAREGLARQAPAKSKSSRRRARAAADNSVSGEWSKAQFRVHVKGAPETVFAMCTGVRVDGEQAPAPMTEARRAEWAALVDEYSGEGLRTLALASRDVSPGQPIEWAGEGDGEDGDHEYVRQGMVLLALVGIKDPVRDDVPAAVKTCRGAGIVVRMVTGDNLATARHIARECQILTDEEGGRAITGPEFRAMSDAEIDAMIGCGEARASEELRVIARCSPVDKQRLVARLQARGRVVASTGDGTNDAPQLKAADVGFAMNISGTEVAKEACDIVLLDDNFASIVKAVLWGRNVLEAVRKFIQFQLTVNCVALIVAFVSSVYLGFSALTAMQLLWLNLIMDTMGALALATDEPDPALLRRRPAGRNEPLITRRMWRFVIGHALWQCAWLITLLVLFKERRGHDTYFFHEHSVPPEPCLPSHLGCICRHNGTTDSGFCLPGMQCVTTRVSEQEGWCVSGNLTAPAALAGQVAAGIGAALGDVCNHTVGCAGEFTRCHEPEFLVTGQSVCLDRYASRAPESLGQTVIFNVFVWMQVFNEFNARNLGDSLSFWRGLSKNGLFWLMMLIIVVGQLLMTLFGGAFTGTMSLGGLAWAGCFIIAITVWPWGVLLRKIPVGEWQPPPVEPAAVASATDAKEGAGDAETESRDVEMTGELGHKSSTEPTVGTALDATNRALSTKNQSPPPPSSSSLSSSGKLPKSSSSKRSRSRRKKKSAAAAVASTDGALAHAPSVTGLISSQQLQSAGNETNDDAADEEAAVFLAQQERE